MLEVMIIGIFQLILFYLFLRTASNIGLVDIPNARSSHSATTTRGAGFIIPIGVIIYIALQYPEQKMFSIGLILISLLSFVDDLSSLNPVIRLLGQTLATILLFVEIGTGIPWYILICTIVFVVGVLNAYNFMDGVNGMLVSYTLVFFLSSLFVNLAVVEFINYQILLVCIVGVLIFSFYNFRHKALCFAGDVGSVGSAFIVVYVVGILILESSSISWMLFLTVYGIDSAFTMFTRLKTGKNIFEAHRNHLYQHLTNEAGISPLKVSSAYALIQLLINVVVIINFKYELLPEYVLFPLIIVPFILVYFQMQRPFQTTSSGSK